MLPSDDRTGWENPYASPASPPPALHTPNSDDPEQAVLRAFVGPRAHYYLAKWALLLHHGHGSAGFNWAAFFLTSLWLPYRKMYRAALLFYVVLILETIIELIIFVGILGAPDTPAGLDAISGLLVAVICGAYGNRWYLSHARALVAQFRRDGLEGEALLQRVSERGGTSLVAAIGMFTLFMAVFMAVFTAADSVLF